MRLSYQLSLLSFLPLFSTFILFASPSFADPYPIERGGKKYFCETNGSKSIPMKMVKGRYISYGSIIKSQKKKIKKASGIKRLKLQKSLAKLKKVSKSATSACRNSSPPPSNPTSVPTSAPTSAPTPLPDALSLDTFSDQVTAEHMRLLLERTAYGLSSQSQDIVNIGIAQGLDAALAELMRIKEEPAGLIDRVNDRLDGQFGNLSTQLRTSFNPTNFGRAELDFAINTNNPYYSNLQHFFLGLWTVGANVLTNDQMYLWWDYWNEILYKTALDPNIPEMLVKVGRHPLMLIYLDNSKNLKFSVNENYGRELLELFSMGPVRIDRQTNQATDNYVEFRGQGDRTAGDIYRISESLTGWRVSALPDGNNVTQWRSVYSDSDHQEGVRQVFEGTPWEFSATDDASVVRGIFAGHPAPRDYLAKEILQWYLTPNPPIELVRALGDQIHADNYQLGNSLRKLFKSKAFFHQNYKDSLPKTSHQIATEFARTMELYRTPEVAQNLEAGINIPNYSGNANQSGNLFRIGYDTTTPPDVFFFRDSQWSSAATLLETVNLFFGMLADTTTQNRISWTPAKILPNGEASAEDVINSVSARLGCSLSANARSQIEYFMNYRRAGVNHSRLLYDNLVLEHQSTKGRYLPAMIASQPCFLMK